MLFRSIVCAGDEIHPADLKLVPLLPPADRRGPAPAASSAAPVFGGYRGPADQGVSRDASVRADAPDPARASALARLPALFEQLLREGGDGLFDAVESALVHAAFDHAHRNQVRSARALGVTRNMVRTLLKRHGLLAGHVDESDGHEAPEGHEADPEPAAIGLPDAPGGVATDRLSLSAA